MKNKSVVIVAGMLLVSGLVFVGTQRMSLAQENQRPARTLSGTWLTTVSMVNCDTGAPAGPAFPGILSFHNDGTMSGTSTVAASVFGVWARGTGWENYSFAFTNFRFNSSSIFVGRQTVRQTVTLGASGNEFSSVGTVNVLDADGATIGQACANATGTQFE